MFRCVSPPVEQISPEIVATPCKLVQRVITSSSDTFRWKMTTIGARSIHRAEHFGMHLGTNLHCNFQCWERTTKKKTFTHPSHIRWQNHGWGIWKIYFPHFRTETGRHLLSSTGEKCRENGVSRKCSACSSSGHLIYCRKFVHVVDGWVGCPPTWWVEMKKSFYFVFLYVARYIWCCFGGKVSFVFFFF